MSTMASSSNGHPNNWVARILVLFRVVRPLDAPGAGHVAFPHKGQRYVRPQRKVAGPKVSIDRQSWETPGTRSAPPKERRLQLVARRGIEPCFIRERTRPTLDERAMKSFPRTGAQR